jgi:CheY-like chemotaxis protein
MLAMFLRRWGYTVFEAGDGREALALWTQHRTAIDLLYTDAVMPGGLSGWELAERLRSEQPHLKIILSSGYTAEMVRHDQTSHPGVTFVPKPCTPTDLAAALRTSLAQPGR